jgi:hypothetical protein
MRRTRRLHRCAPSLPGRPFAATILTGMTLASAKLLVDRSPGGGFHPSDRRRPLPAHHRHFPQCAMAPLRFHRHGDAHDVRSAERRAGRSEQARQRAGRGRLFRRFDGPSPGTTDQRLRTRSAGQPPHLFWRSHPRFTRPDEHSGVDRIRSDRVGRHRGRGRATTPTSSRAPAFTCTTPADTPSRKAFCNRSSTRTRPSWWGIPSASLTRLRRK